MYTPYHKQTNPNKQAGQIVNPVVSNVKQKLTFEQWMRQYNTLHGCPPIWVVAEAAWKAGQENK